MNIRPLHDRVIVERVEEETKTAGGLFIPDSAKEKPQKGIIIAAGHTRCTEYFSCAIYTAGHVQVGVFKVGICVFQVKVSLL